MSELKMPWKRAIGSVTVLLLALLLPGLPAGAASGLPARAASAVPAAVRGTSGAGHGLVVPTDRGLVKGKSAEGTDQWLGIPYAAPPADSPSIVTWPGSPPNAAMLRCTHRSAASWSSRP